MNCEQVRPILLDYVMDEVPAADREAIHRHLETCAACSEEAGKCRQTLSHLAQGAAFEEVPQRIRVVAEPAAAGWWSGFWHAPARLVFAASGLACVSIALLALARTTIRYQQGNFEIAFGARTPAAGNATSVVAAPPAGVHSVSREEVAQLIAEAVAASDARQSGNTAQALDQAAKQAEGRRLDDRLEMAESLRYFQAAQMNMWKQQVENQEVVATLMARQNLPAVAP